jgi:hypothetical protein
VRSDLVKFSLRPLRFGTPAFTEGVPGMVAPAQGVPSCRRGLSPILKSKQSATPEGESKVNRCLELIQKTQSVLRFYAVS